MLGLQAGSKRKACQGSLLWNMSTNIVLLLLNQTEEMEQPDKITARQDMKIQYCLYIAALSEDDVNAICVDQHLMRSY